ncbi:MAG: D-alanine--D-alanine ligase [Candidatus Brocadiales bacterium]
MVTKQVYPPAVSTPVLTSEGQVGKRVVVLMGGASPEREVSILSGWAVVRALRELGYMVTPIMVDDEEVRGLDGLDVDVVFIAMHGYFGEDGGVQRLLESREIPYTGSGVQASRMAMDKVETKWAFVLSGYSTPEFMTLRRGQPIQELEGLLLEKLPLPLVAKPSRSGSSIGVSIVRDVQELPQALETAFRYDEKVVVERYIRGRELTVGILGDEALPVIEIRPAREFYDLSAKYKDSGTSYITTPEIPKDIYAEAQQLALDAHHKLGCSGFSRVDMILSGEMELFLLEINTIPGLTERSLLPKAAEAAGISFQELCREIVLLAQGESEHVKENDSLKCVGV